MSGNLKEILAQLQRNYLASMPEKIAALDTFWKKRDFELLETDYHKLKGTGRTYGLPEVTQIGAALERLCEIDRDALERAVPMSLKLLTRIQEMRLAGQVPNLEHDPDFQVIVVMVENADKKAVS